MYTNSGRNELKINVVLPHAKYFSLDWRKKQFDFKLSIRLTETSSKIPLDRNKTLKKVANGNIFGGFLTESTALNATQPSMGGFTTDTSSTYQEEFAHVHT